MIARFFNFYAVRNLLAEAFINHAKLQRTSTSYTGYISDLHDSFRAAILGMAAERQASNVIYMKGARRTLISWIDHEVNRHMNAEERRFGEVTGLRWEHIKQAAQSGIRRKSTRIATIVTVMKPDMLVLIGAPNFAAIWNRKRRQRLSRRLRNTLQPETILSLLRRGTGM